MAGHVETDDPLEDAWREIQGQADLQDDVMMVKRGEPFTFTAEDEGQTWCVHPFLFDTSSREARLDWEVVDGAWVAPTAIIERDCVRHLCTSYGHVAPMLEDREHDSTSLSLRALEMLCDRAAAPMTGVEGSES